MPSKELRRKTALWANHPRNYRAVIYAKQILFSNGCLTDLGNCRLAVSAGLLSASSTGLGFGGHPDRGGEVRAAFHPPKNFAEWLPHSVPTNRTGHCPRDWRGPGSIPRWSYAVSPTRLIQSRDRRLSTGACLRHQCLCFHLKIHLVIPWGTCYESVVISTSQGSLSASKP